LFRGSVATDKTGREANRNTAGENPSINGIAEKQKSAPHIRDALKVAGSQGFVPRERSDRQDRARSEPEHRR